MTLDVNGASHGECSGLKLCKKSITERFEDSPTGLFYTGLQLVFPLPALLLHRYGRAPVLLRKPRPPAAPTAEAPAGTPDR